MPLTLRRGHVTAITEQVEGLIRLEVDDLQCIAYPRLTGAVEVGDEVLVNEQARLLTVAGALSWAKAELADAAVCSVGPGIVGTGSRLGHGALALADVANVATALGGRPVLAVRTSDADPRERHRGVSHHARAVLDLSLGVVVAEDAHGQGWEDACAGLPLSHMGRGPDEDPSFFRAAYAAGA